MLKFVVALDTIEGDVYTSFDSGYDVKTTESIEFASHFTKEQDAYRTIREYEETFRNMEVSPFVVRLSECIEKQKDRFYLIGEHDLD